MHALLEVKIELSHGRSKNANYISQHYVTFQLAYGKSVAIPRCPLVTEITLGVPSGVFLNLESKVSHDFSC